MSGNDDDGRIPWLDGYGLAAAFVIIDGRNRGYPVGWGSSVLLGIGALLARNRVPLRWSIPAIGLIGCATCVAPNIAIRRASRPSAQEPQDPAAWIHNVAFAQGAWRGYAVGCLHVLSAVAVWRVAKRLHSKYLDYVYVQMAKRKGSR